jgi:hypothetical protein
MQAKSLIHRWHLTALGAILCLLAAAFSFEAKIAWYGPTTADTHVSATKLEPSEAADLVARALAFAAHPMYTAPQIEWLAVFAVLAVPFAPRRRADSEFTRASISPGFSPFRFSRPPPTR